MLFPINIIMIKNRLVTFGCSYTYGLHLPDCNDQKGESPPSLYAWPNILKNTLGFSSLDNKGFPGASNYFILNNLLNYNFKKKSFVVILWTHFGRYTKYPNEENWINFNVNDDKSKTMFNFLKVVPEYHLYKINSDCINYAYYYLKYKNIPFRFDFSHDYEYDIFVKYRSKNKSMVSNIFFNSFCKDFGSDNLHPGIESHKSYGNFLATEILKQI